MAVLFKFKAIKFIYMSAGTNIAKRLCLCQARLLLLRFTILKIYMKN